MNNPIRDQPLCGDLQVLHHPKEGSSGVQSLANEHKTFADRDRTVAVTCGMALPSRSFVCRLVLPEKARNWKTSTKAGLVENIQVIMSAVVCLVETRHRPSLIMAYRDIQSCSLVALRFHIAALLIKVEAYG